jgi:carbonic anhydrase
MSPETGYPPDGQRALERLIAGNTRYVTMRARHPNQSQSDRQTLLDGQHPFAAILGCSDSRVPVEIVFDQGLGDLFVIRVAGNLVGALTLASIEFAVNVLHVPLVLVLGHSGCGAVSATLRGDPLPGHLPHITDAVRPAVDAARDQPGDLLENVVRSNARLSATRMLAESDAISDAVRDNTLTVAAAYYDIATGKVDVLD